MTAGHSQEDRSVVNMEGSCTPLSTASSGRLVEDKSHVPALAIMECHICMDAAKDPVAASCGHVFCWPCLSEWLQNAPKPCPICKTVLSRNVNILSLHHGARDATARPSHGNDDSATGAPAAGNVANPPRPGNPQLFFPMESGSSPQSVTKESLALCRAIGELVRQRSRGRSVVLERARMNHRTNVWPRQRNSDLMQEGNRRGQHNAQLQRRWARAHRQLPFVWNTGGP